MADHNSCVWDGGNNTHRILAQKVLLNNLQKNSHNLEQTDILGSIPRATRFSEK
jgi:hypothetical protein